MEGGKMKLIKYIIHQWKLRHTLKPFNVWTQQIDFYRKDCYWLGYDDKIYYGHRFGYLAESAQNEWYKKWKEAK